jgi:transposase
MVAIPRFEKLPVRQAQMEWGHIGIHLRYGRMLMRKQHSTRRLGMRSANASKGIPTIRWGPEKILCDRMKTVWLAVDERGEIVWNPVFLDSARYWGFTLRLWRPHRAQTKGKSNPARIMWRKVLCGLLGHEPSGLEELRARLREWVQNFAKRRVTAPRPNTPSSAGRTAGAASNAG